MNTIEILISLITSISVFLLFLYYYIKLRQKRRLLMSFFSSYTTSQQSYFERVEKKWEIAKKINILIKNTKLRINLFQFLIISLVFTVVGIAFGIFVTGIFFIGIVIGSLAGVIPYIYLLNRNAKRLREVTIEFAPMLKHMANYHRAGNNLRQSIEKTALVTDGQLGEILEGVVKMLNGGATVSKSIEAAYEKAPLVEFKMFYILISIHHDMGGDLAGSLDNLAETIEDKKALRIEIDNLTQETRTSSYISAIIPMALYLIMRLTAPEYVKQVNQLPFGQIGIFASFIFIVLGVLVIKKISNVKVDKAYR